MNALRDLLTVQPFALEDSTGSVVAHINHFIVAGRVTLVYQQRFPQDGHPRGSRIQLNTENLQNDIDLLARKQGDRIGAGEIPVLAPVKA